MALTLAACRGVQVDLLLPRRSSHRVTDMARPAALREVTAAGGCIWLADTMIYAKAVVIDNEFALAGSANLDERSLFLNYELMVAFFEPADVARFAHWIERQRGAGAIAGCAARGGRGADPLAGLSTVSGADRSSQKFSTLLPRTFKL